MLSLEPLDLKVEELLISDLRNLGGKSDQLRGAQAVTNSETLFFEVQKLFKPNFDDENSRVKAFEVNWVDRASL